MSVKPNFLANKIVTLFIIFSIFSLSNIAMAFTDTDGKITTVNDYLGKGKFTIVEVWSTNCPACRKHMPSMVEFDGKLKNTQILGISLDTQAEADAVDDFIMEYNIEFPILISNAIEMNIWMQQNSPEGLIGTPTFMIFNPKGELFAMQAGPVGIDQMEKLILSKSKVTATTQ